jgi:predicted 3-demethylubiquinone-9 3-methyltransferase (glyoxalase superfamily)
MKIKANGNDPKITPFLWFDGQAGAAAKFYTSVFKRSKIVHSTPMMTIFWLDGQKFMALNGGPHFKFNEAVSFLVQCGTQREVDYYWNKLTSGGGQESQCGWLKDKFGLSWQIVPDTLGELMGDADEEKSGRVMQALMKMKKIIVADLKKAHAGR